MDKNHRRWVAALAIIVAALLLFGFGFNVWLQWRRVELTRLKNSLPVMTSADCAARSGEIVTLGNEALYRDSRVIGQVSGLQCPCVCLRRR